MPASILGLDIGGANLKAAHTSGAVLSRPFELWRRPGELAGAPARRAARVAVRGPARPSR